MAGLIKSLINYDDAKSFANQLRSKRAETILFLMENCFKRSGKCRILDLGGTYRYWQIIPPEYFDKYNVSVVLLNITRSDVPDSSLRYVSISGNACNLSEYRDQEFDLVHSNSVIEHVGAWENMSAMATEMARVGYSYYLQTPYFWFPVEPHFLCPFIHWLPMSWRVKIAMRFALGNWPMAKSIDEAVRAQSSSVLLDRVMVRDLLPEATVKFEWLFGFPKSIIAYKE